MITVKELDYYANEGDHYHVFCNCPYCENLNEFLTDRSFDFITVSMSIDDEPYECQHCGKDFKVDIKTPLEKLVRRLNENSNSYTRKLSR